MLMQAQSLSPRPLDDYRELVDSRGIEDLALLAAQLRDKKIYEINSTATGGGVVELLRAQIPLALGLGMNESWLVLPPDDAFFAVTKGIHNALQGDLTIQHNLSIFDAYSEKVAASLPLDGDLYILHDPQTLGLIAHLTTKPVIWRCHIDLTRADPATHRWLVSKLAGVQNVIVSLPDYAAGMNEQPVAVVQPSIDPLAVKNAPLDGAEAERLLQAQGIDTTRPFITQVSRYDPWKDPIGVINLYDELFKLDPTMQCVLLGNKADDDPEGEAVFQQVAQRATQSTGTIRLLTESTDELVNALQSRAAAVIQYSSREGFGLTVTEALWKSRLVSARPVGGIALQVLDGQTGLAATGDPVVDAQRLHTALADKEMCARLGKQAHEHVQHKFITPIMLRDYLRVYAAALSKTEKAT